MKHNGTSGFYREGRAWPLTSPTTCYSGSNGCLSSRPFPDRSTSNAAASWSFATAHHYVQLKLQKNGDSNAEPVDYSYQSFEHSVDGTTTSCIGYDSLGDHCQVFCFMNISNGTTTPEDNPSISTAAPVPPAGAALRRRTSSTVDAGDGSSTTTAAPTLSSTTTSGQANNSTIDHRQRLHQQSDSTLASPEPFSRHLSLLSFDSTSGSFDITGGGAETVATSSAEGGETGGLYMACSLVMMIRSSDASHDTIPQCYRLDLGFRPLSPALCSVTAHDDRVATDDDYLVWLGSADSHKLFCFRPNAATRTLQQVSLEDDSFSMESYVMALCCQPLPDGEMFHVQDDDDSDGGEYQNYTCHVLGVAYQDGTTRLITWRLSGRHSNTLVVLDNHTIVVDGPLISINVVLSKGALAVANNDDSANDDVPASLLALVVTVGSLAGYAMQLHRLLLTGHEWSMPVMVTGGDDALHLMHAAMQNNGAVSDMSDSVLTVQCVGDDSAVDGHEADAFQGMGHVWVGTYDGRCALYRRRLFHGEDEPSKQTSPFELCWQCQFSYPVHCVIAMGREVCVVTKWSLHVLEPVDGNNGSAKPLYDAQTAQRRLLDIKQRVQQQLSANEVLVSESPAIRDDAVPS